MSWQVKGCTTTSKQPISLLPKAVYQSLIKKGLDHIRCYKNLFCGQLSSVIPGHTYMETNKSSVKIYFRFIVSIFFFVTALFLSHKMHYFNTLSLASSILTLLPKILRLSVFYDDNNRLKTLQDIVILCIWVVLKIMPRCSYYLITNSYQRMPSSILS